MPVGYMMAAMTDTILYDYWRSSSAYRVRIALALLGLDYQRVEVDLVAGDQINPAYRETINPQGLVPGLTYNGQQFTQSLAIIEYLNELHGGCRLLPEKPADRALVRALSYAIAMEIHPVCNLSVVAHATVTSGAAIDREKWMQHFINKGLANFEQLLQQQVPIASGYCFGDQISMADICLVPQIYNATRWGVDWRCFKTLAAIHDRLIAIPAFQAAAPEAVRATTGT